MPLPQQNRGNQPYASTVGNAKQPWLGQRVFEQGLQCGPTERQRTAHHHDGDGAWQAYLPDKQRAGFREPVLRTNPQVPGTQADKRACQQQQRERD